MFHRQQRQISQKGNKPLAKQEQRTYTTASSVNGMHPATLIQRAKDDPSSLSSNEVLTLQKTMGNRATTQLLAGSSRQRVQPKLTIGEPGDKYEQEADRVAAKVVQQMNAPASSQASQRESVQRQEREDDELMMKPMVQRQSDGGMAATPDLEASINQGRGSGQPLANSIREPIEQAFGADFSGVKVHTDAQSDQLNQSIQARAFTTGQDIFFRQGEYNPGSRGGQELIAHELTHVVQQNGSAVQRESEKQARKIEPSEKAVLQRSDKNETEEEKEGVVVMNKRDQLVVQDENQGELLIALTDKKLAVNMRIHYKIGGNKYIKKAEVTQVGDRPAATDAGGARANRNNVRTTVVRANNFLTEGRLVLVGRGDGGARKHYGDSDAKARNDSDIPILISTHQSKVKITDSDSPMEDDFAIPLGGNYSIAGAIRYRDSTKVAVNEIRVWHVGPSQGLH
jgi:hypothetical protein